jgi:two-component system response regulator ChvI
MTIPQNETSTALPPSHRDLSQNSDRTDLDFGGPIRTVLVDDDADYREAVATELERLGFQVASLATGEALLDYFDRDTAEVIVLDWQLERGLGIDLLPLLRDRGVALPVVFLTGMPATTAEYIALDRGAVDFIDKTRGTRILAKRLQLIVHTYRGMALPAANDPVQCGNLVLRTDIGRAYWSGQDLDLTLTEFKIIALLASRPGEFVTYRSIYDCVHHEGFVAGTGDDGYRTNVRSSIKRIRSKFCERDAGFSEIENYAAFGYRWRAARAVAA